MSVAAPARPRFVEPTRAGSPAVYAVRYLLGIALLVLGLVLMLVGIWPPLRFLQLRPDMLPPLVVGGVLLTGAWFVLPGRPGRAAGAAGLGLLAVLLVETSLPLFRGGGLASIVGFGSLWILHGLAVTAIVAAWFLVRRRPPLVFALLPLPFIVYAVLRATSRPGTLFPGEALFQDVVMRATYPEFLRPLLIGLNRLDSAWYLTAGAALVILAIIVGSAWLGRLLAPVMRGTDPAVRAQREAAQYAAWHAHVQAQQHAAAQADAAWRVAEIRRWEDAYAAAHDGERPPPGWSPPAATPFDPRRPQ